jgi:hypothetical protein
MTAFAIALAVIVIALDMALARRAFGGWLAGFHFMRKPVALAFAIVMAGVVGLAISWIVALLLVAATWVHFTFDHADDWTRPCTPMNILRFSLAPLVLAVIALITGNVVAALVLAAIGPLSAGTYWAVQNSPLKALLEKFNSNPVKFIDPNTAFIDGPFAVAELGFGLWWGLGICLALIGVR